MSSDACFAVAISLGPVAGFISAGRRSRDLWYGSRMLWWRVVEVADWLNNESEKQHFTLDWCVPTADRLHKHFKEVFALNSTAAQILVPTADRLHEHFKPKNDPDWGATGSNKLHFFVSGSNDEALRKLLSKARGEMREWFADNLETLEQSAKGMGINHEALKAQVEAIRQGDFLEFYASWVRVGSGENARAHALSRARKLTDEARKSTRLFPPADWSQQGLWKSSLDPGRDSVLEPLQLESPRLRETEKAERKRWHLARSLWGIRSEERLDAVGLHRRFSMMQSGPEGDKPQPLQFPPLARVAADPWLEGVHQENPKLLKEIRDLLHTPTVEHGLALLSTPCKDPGGYFDLDPSLLFEDALAARWFELEHAGLSARARFDPNLTIDDGDLRWAAQTLHKLKAPVETLHKDFGPPLHYYAMLEADGDGIGAALNHLNNDGLTTAVEALYAFADEAWNIVDRHHGAAFYVGGDELMAWLPVDAVLPCALELGELFQTCTQAVPWGQKEGTPRPALSVGIVISHVKADLREVRKQTHDALARAKKWRKEKAPSAEGGALSLVDDPAGGSSRECIGSLKELVPQLVQLVDNRQDEELSLSTAHDLLGLVRTYTEGGTAEEVAERMAGDTALVLARALLKQKWRRDGKASRKGQSASAFGDALQKATSWRDVQQLAHRLLLATRIQRVAAQRRGATPTWKQASTKGGQNE